MYIEFITNFVKYIVMLDNIDLLRVEVQTCKINTLFVSLQMLCEVETAMYNLQIDLPPPHNTTIITPEFWSKEGGVTQMLIQDWGVLKIYGDFVYDWTLGMNNILNATLPDTCKIRSHDKNPKRRCILKKKHLKLLKMKKSRMLKKQNLRRNSSSNRISRRKLFNLE